MLTIRDLQMKIFGEEMRRRFELRMAQDLRVAFPERTERFNEDDLRSVIHRAIDHCISHGINLEGDVARYLEYVIRYGADFGSASPRVSRILEMKGINGTQKMDRIDEYDEFGQLAGSEPRAQGSVAS